MTNGEGNPNDQTTKRRSGDFRHSGFVIPSSLRLDLIATDPELTQLVCKINAADRIALDTEADSLHSYREKLCLLQMSVPAVASIDDAGPDVETGSGTRDQRSRL